MRWSDIKEDGRIVKGVNTTVDVDTDEIKTQAAKFGNSVDKDGRPTTLSKKVKGKSTNVLFNLGLAESVNEEKSKLVDYITPDLKKLEKIFSKSKFDIRIVGGAVRDVALGKEPKDIDLATDATPKEMQRMFDRASIKHIPSGIEHGTITAIIGGEDFEITTLRADAETDGRHAKVEFVKSWEEDARRRDLTYNAMSMDFAGNIYDYYGGMDDLQSKTSRFVGVPEERIQEDYLRILRYFRFQGRMDNPTWDKDVITVIRDNADGLQRVSVERIWMEMSKILSGNNIDSVLRAMDTAGILSILKIPTKNIQDVVDGENEIVNLARLGDAGIGKRWKFSNADNQTLNFLVKNKDAPINKKILSDLIVDGISKLFLYRWAELKGVIGDLGQHIKSFNAPVFPVNGNDLMQAGIEKGPNLGKVLNDLKVIWKDSNYTASKKDLLSNIKVDNTNESMLYLKQMQESMGQISKTTKIYVDMDGVLADFFGSWAKLMGKNDYREIKDIVAGLQKIKDTEGFWLNLPLTSNAKSLLNVIKQVKGEYYILSTPLPGDPNSEPHKREWVKKHLSNFMPKEVIITSNKPKYATNADGSTNILIDDYGVNINAWEAAGGIGFKHKDHKFERTSKEIKQHIQEPAVEEGIADTLSAFADKILGKMEKWWNKQVNAHEMAWAEVEKILKPYAEELRDLIKDPNDFGMLMLLIKHNQGKKPLLDKLFAKIRQFGIKAVYKMQGLENKFATENFADGKKPGRKGLAKRSGVNTKASVSSLRKTAKSSSGEKQRMAHWLANMKAGRKKNS